MVNQQYQCYSHSLTLDISNGKKLDDQRLLVKELGLENTVYVYWYDLPCVKGIFWMLASDTYKEVDSQTVYDRRLADGDFFPGGMKRAATKKIYLPLTKMNDLESLVDWVIN